MVIFTNTSNPAVQVCWYGFIRGGSRLNSRGWTTFCVSSWLSLPGFFAHPVLLRFGFWRQQLATLFFLFTKYTFFFTSMFFHFVDPFVAFCSQYVYSSLCLLSCVFASDLRS